MHTRAKTSIAVIIPTYNRDNLLSKLLSQLEIQISNLYIPKLFFKVIVIVDGSTDRTLELLEVDFPFVHSIIGNGSWWYTRSINIGFKYAIENLKPDFVLALNDDVVLSDTYLYEMSKIIQINDYNTIVGSCGLTIEQPHKVITSGNNYSNKIFGTYKPHLPFLYEVNPNKLSGTLSSITLPGRGMLIPTSTLVNLDYFDERFKQYHSDGDFTLRAIKLGYKVQISLDAKIFLHHKETSSSTSYLNKSYWTLIKSYFSPTSRNYLPSKCRFLWRHGNKWNFPLQILIFILLNFKKIHQNKDK